MIFHILTRHNIRNYVRFDKNNVGRQIVHLLLYKLLDLKKLDLRSSSESIKRRLSGGLFHSGELSLKSQADHSVLNCGVVLSGDGFQRSEAGDTAYIP